MAAIAKPIPALYTVYILRSTVRHASLYIGSTTDPPRRLKQHNGEIRGGAARTSRASLRPWEMVGLVSGFPGAVAALKFEWALTNPHISLHIPSDERITKSRQTKRNGHPKRPSASLQSVIANLHLLLRVPSFSRWPLRLHIFVPEVYAAWQKWCISTDVALSETLEVVTDFGPRSREEGDVEISSDVSAPAVSTAAKDVEPWGIHALPLDYAPIRDYVDKANEIFTFEREGDCVVCNQTMPPAEGLYAVCPNSLCEAVGHLRCWSDRIIAGDATPGKKSQDLIPVKGSCPRCGGNVVWVDMMKELTLRTRAPNEVNRLLKAKRQEEKAEKAAKAKQAKEAKKEAAKKKTSSGTDTEKEKKKAPSVRKTKATASASKPKSTSRVTKTTKTAAVTKPAARRTAKAKAKEKAQTETAATTDVIVLD